MSPFATAVTAVKVKELLYEGALLIVQPSPGQYISHIFPVPKRTPDEFRIIFDLSILNKFIRKLSFRMDTYFVIIGQICRGDFFISIDLTDAYHAIALHPDFMRFMTFIFQNVYYQFTCLPQGLTSAPRIFTKIMRVVLTYFRSFSIRIAAWLDDFLVAASSAALASSQASFITQKLDQLGFVPNLAKSQLVPVQRIHHVGLIWDSVSFTVSVPDDKLIAIQAKCARALSAPVSVRFLYSILGSLEFFRWGFFHAPIHYRALQRNTLSFLSRGLSYDDIVTVSSCARVDLNWWIDCGSELPPRTLSPFSASLSLVSDASLTGWGAWSSEGENVFGNWSLKESACHINELELKAVLFAFQCLYRNTYNTSILIRSDNTTVVAYINKQGGTTSKVLCDLAIELWKFCIHRNLCISASHISGVSNDRADELSRRSSSEHSYFLLQDVFDSLSEFLSFPLSLDCFASRLNNKLPKFISRFKDPSSSLVDAFSLTWTDNLYLFPPVPLIFKVLNKFHTDRVASGVIICPYWPSQPWFPLLLDLLIGPPLLFPAGSVQDPDAMLPNHCQFLAWIIGISPALRKEYLETLPNAPSGALSRKPWLGTKGLGENSPIGVIQGKLVKVVCLLI